nr:HlyD family efflux transporter periplasmic adaptor subunit [Kofleriaceae bacterium]
MKPAASNHAAKTTLAPVARPLAQPVARPAAAMPVATPIARPHAPGGMPMPASLAPRALQAPAPTVLHTRIVLDDVEVLERTYVHPSRLANGSAPQPLGLTPVLEREVFELARRVALQPDVESAVRVLRTGAARLVNAPDVGCLFHDPRSPMPELPAGTVPSIHDQAQHVVARVARTGERIALANALVEPVGPAPARAVLVVRRPAGHPPFGPLELALVQAIARAVAGILSHFQADHAAKQEQAARDAKTPFRPEVLAEKRRAAAAPGRIVATPRTWIRYAFPTLLGLVAATITAAALVQVPTYSTGVGIVVVDGEQVTSPQPGTVAEVLVAPNAIVAAGDPLVRMHAQQEEAELAATDTDYRNALGAFLTTPGDDYARSQLAAIATRRQRAQAELDTRTLRAPVAGVIGDIRVRAGQLVMPGTQVLKISPADATPNVVALLPGFDRPRLAVGMTVQLELPGYRTTRPEAVIDSIATQVVGPDEARRALGDPIGDALPINGPVVIVRAHLSQRTFEAEGRDFEFHDGMLGKAEVRVDRKSLLRTLIPGSEGNE